MLSFVWRVIQVAAVPKLELANAPATTGHATRDAAVHHPFRRRPGYSEERLRYPNVVQPFAGSARSLPASWKYSKEGRTEGHSSGRAEHAAGRPVVRVAPQRPVDRFGEVRAGDV